LSRLLFPLVLLTLVYALVLGSFHPWDLALGAVASGALLLAAPGRVARGDASSSGGARSGRVRGLPARAAAFPALVAAVAWDVAVGTWEVALVTLGLRPQAKPGIVAVPVGERTPTGVAVSTLCATLSPGEVLVEVDEERNAILLHVIDASDPDAVRARLGRFYERYQRRVFP
jgi:multisubunit Na+/H+ antiporter MnhE subunit